MKVGLVLGAGGFVGGAWLTGALDALAERTGWDPGGAERIVGTSAGAVVGAMAAAGVPPRSMVAHSRGEVLERLDGSPGGPAGDPDRVGGGALRLHRGVPSIGPGSLRLALTSLSRPLRSTPLALTVGWLPRGMISTDALRETVARVVPEGWVEHPGFRAVACDYGNGRRVVFGRDDAPAADLPDAVAASCAIPGFYRPVTIDGRDYVDGAVCSPSNLDLVAGDGLDLVICVNPTSTRERSGGPGVGDRVARALRAASGRRLGHEAKRVRAGGAEVVLIQPVAEDLVVMGRNLMNGRRSARVIETARRTVSEQLADPALSEVLSRLPAGDPHGVGRPSGSPDGWPRMPGADVPRAA